MKDELVMPEIPRELFQYLAVLQESMGAGERGRWLTKEEIDKQYPWNRTASD